MHREEPGLDGFPVGLFCPKGIKHPEEKPDGKVAIVRPMPDNVTRTDIISDMDMIMAHEKVIPDRTRSSPFARAILRKPYRKVSLTAKRIVSEMINQVI